MMSISNVSAGAAASGYYKEEGYYKSGSPESEAAAQWFGKAAEEIGLTGNVNDRVFAEFLDGQAPDGKLMGRWVEGERQHRPGLDLTFSASKSASVAALVIGDDRITQAHDAAVRAAMSVVEERFIKTRWQRDGEMQSGAGEGIIAGIYRHDTSRALDPNLHSHAVIANMVKNEAGGYTALRNEETFRNQKLITEIYRSEFEDRMRAHGIATERGKHGEVNITGIPEQVVEAFSKRRQEILASLEDKGLEANASNSEKATLATRANKHRDLDRSELRADWRDQARAAGLDQARLEMGRVQSHAPAPEIPQDQQRPLGAQSDPTILDRAKALVTGSVPSLSPERRGADSALDKAVAHISERQSAYSRSDLAVAAMRFGRDTKFAAIDREIDQRLKDGRLFEGSEEKDLLTDKASVALERSILATYREAQKLGGVSLEHYKERSAESTLATKLSAGNALSDGQKEAVVTALTGQGRYVGVQGFAGTGKTFMMDRVAHYAAQSGYEVKGFAPSHQAVGELSATLGTAETVAKVVTSERHHPQDVDNSRAILIVDEASMMSAQDLRSFMDYAERTGAARVVFVGDTQQLDAVAAGQPFAQLQEAGMRIAVMDEIRRQRDTDLKEAVYHAIRSEIGDAFSRLDGNVQRVENPRAEAAQRYLDLTPSERENTRVLTLTNRARTEINELVRQGLREEGQLGKESVSLDGLVNQQRTMTELADARTYGPGDVVQSMVSSREYGLKKQDLYVVREINHRANSITVTPEKPAPGDSSRLTLPLSAAFNKRELGKSLVAYDRADREISAGDLVRFRISDPESGLKNGTRAKIVSAGQDGIEAEHPDGTRFSVVRDSLAARGLEHDYAATAHAVQGETVDRVIVAMSATERLVSQKSFYVEISRARDEAVLLTDNPGKLSKRVEEETGKRQTALDTWIEGRLVAQRDRAAPEDQSQSKADEGEKSQSRQPEQDNKEPEQKSRQIEMFGLPEALKEAHPELKEIEKEIERQFQKSKEITR